MAFYRDFCTTSDHAYNMRQALRYCKEHRETELILDQGTYDFYPDKAAEAYYCITNHGYAGLKRIGLHLRDMQDLTVDGNGSTFVFHGIMCPIIVDSCRNITLRHINLDTPEVFILQGKIVEVGDGYADWQPEYGTFTFRHNDLYIEIGGESAPGKNPLEYNSQTHALRANTANFCFGPRFAEQRKEQLPNGNIRIYDVTKKPVLGDRVVINAEKRFTSNIFIKDSENTTIEDLTIYRGIGMGVVAQRSKDITFYRYNTKPRDGYYFSASADATHFNNCKGLIRLENCSFENQLDDGLNIHGLYTKIEEKTENTLLLHFMHKEARGIDVYSVGDTVAAADPQSLLSAWHGTITDIEPLNLDYVRITVDTSTEDVRVGDILEDVTANADLTVRNCIFRNNKCRGMLLGTRGKVVIENCEFHSAGCGIKFECDGEYWYESGPARDVTIRNNVFDHCKDGDRDMAIIECTPRKKVVENQYYHQNIRIENNVFKTNGEPVLYADNIDGLVFSGNQISDLRENSITVNHCTNVQIDS